jgi:predicted PurR-regulated permease PerM
MSRYTLTGTFLLLLAATLIGAAGSLLDPSLVEFEQQVALVGGMSASVEPNAINQLAQQLDQKARSLDARERLLDARERALSEQLSREVRSSYLSIIAFVTIAILLLLTLIGLNFYLDAHREASRSTVASSVRRGELLTRL